MLPIILGLVGSYLIVDSQKDEKYADGGLIAPNGKKSNLTPEQYKLVRTPAFKKWFGDWENDPENASKVVDMNGEPLVVWHGTGTEFYEFKIGRTRGLFFTNRYETAKRFSEGDLKREGAKPIILPCFLNIKKPFYKGITKDENLEKDYWENYFKNRPFITKKSQKSILSQKDKFSQEVAFFGIVNEEPRFYLIKHKYDGISFLADNMATTYVCFEPNQIKLADGSNTTFDGSNNDIRFEDGGEVEILEMPKVQYKDGGYLRELKDSQPQIKIEKQNLNGIVDAYFKLGSANAHLQYFGEPMGIEGIPNWAKKEYYLENIYRDDYVNTKKDKYSEKKGEGIILFQKILENAKKNKIDIITLKRAEYSGKALHDYYKRLGFVDVGDEEPLGMYLDLRTDEPFKKVEKIVEETINKYKEGGEVDNSILNSAIKQVNSSFTKEVLPFTIIPSNRNQFVISVVNIRGGKEILIDYYFTKKTGKLVKSETISISDSKFKDGGRTIAQTPAPKSDRIYGSKVNPKGSAASEQSASKIVLSKSIIDTLKKKLSEFKEKHPNNKNVTLADLKAVYRRGAGAYSKSHRPTISGGKPNTRNAWAMARVNKFLLKAGGTKVKAAYIQDDDLM